MNDYDQAKTIEAPGLSLDDYRNAFTRSRRDCEARLKTIEMQLEQLSKERAAIREDLSRFVEMQKVLNGSAQAMDEAKWRPDEMERAPYPNRA